MCLPSINTASLLLWHKFCIGCKCEFENYRSDSIGHDRQLAVSSKTDIWKRENVMDKKVLGKARICVMANVYSCILLELTIYFGLDFMLNAKTAMQSTFWHALLLRDHCMDAA